MIDIDIDREWMHKHVFTCPHTYLSIFLYIFIYIYIHVILSRIHRHLKYYVGCFVLYWTCVLLAYTCFSVIPYSSPYKSHIWKILSCLLLSKGMVNSVIWTRTSNILKIVQQLREFGYVEIGRKDLSLALYKIIVLSR